MANKHRGEIDLILGDKTYTLRPTMAVLAEIEDQFDGILPLGRRLQNSEWKITEITALLFLLTRPFPDAPDRDALENIVLEHGVFTYVPVILEFLTLALTGGKDG